MRCHPRHCLANWLRFDITSNRHVICVPVMYNDTYIHAHIHIHWTPSTVGYRNWIAIQHSQQSQCVSFTCNLHVCIHTCTYIYIYVYIHIYTRIGYALHCMASRTGCDSASPTIAMWYVHMPCVYIYVHICIGDAIHGKASLMYCGSISPTIAMR